MNTGGTRALSTPLTPPQRELVERGASLVRGTAGWFARCFTELSRDEIEAAGRDGLVEAAQRFDPARGTWERHAKFRIRCAMRDFVRAEMSWRHRMVARGSAADLAGEDPDADPRTDAPPPLQSRPDQAGARMADEMFG